MRAPGRFAVLVALATAALAGFGFDAVRRRSPRRGMALLKQRERIGHPDARTREVFFGKTQLRQGRSPQ